MLIGYRLRTFFFKILIICFAVVHSSYVLNHRLSARIIKTKYGALRGIITSFSNKNLQQIEMFLGVPYASPPIEKLRFMPPVTPAIWSGVRNADMYGPVCPQKFPDLNNETLVLQQMTKGRLQTLQKLQTMLKNQSEDCLYMNIYIPTNAFRENTRLPVLVFFHGESYEWNAGSSYDGSVFASKSNMIIITINFRLGVLGFFPSLGGNARGNFGLMDQVASLHWIQENIREFNGDERNVTILGYGHGAACVNFLMVSPMARGLFHRSILLSGSALSPWAIASDAIFHAKNLAKVLGCMEQPITDHVNTLDCLRKKTVQEILSVDLKIPTHLTGFGPIIDGIVIPNNPQILMSKSKSIFFNYQLMFGVTKAESYNLFSMYDEKHGVDISRRDRLVRTLIRNLYNYHLQEIFLTIVNEYTDWTRSFLHPISLFNSLVDIFSDALIVAPTIKVGLLHSKKSRNTYFYTFTHQTENGDYPSRLGCIHGQDLAYLFGAPLVNGFKLSWFSTNYSRSEITLSENFINFVTNFAKTGNPNNNENLQKFNQNISKNSLDDTFWYPYEEIQQKYLIFDNTISSKDHYLAHRLSYWFNLLPQLHKPGSSKSDEHHLLDSHNNIQTYDGIIRYESLSAPISFNTYFSLESNDNNNLARNFSSFLIIPHGKYLDATDPKHHHSNQSNTLNSNKISIEQSALDLSFTRKSLDNNQNKSSFSKIMQSENLHTLLSLVLAIGCSLLILNILLFTGFYYHRGRNRLETKLFNKKHENLLSKQKKNLLNNENPKLSNNASLYQISENYNQTT